MKKLMSMLRNKKTQAGLAVTAALVSAQSTAAPIDLTGPIDVITTDGTLAITQIGGAMLGLAAVSVIFKWAKGAIFG